MGVITMKKSDLYYEARDAVENGTYLKAKTRTLHKYLAELNIVQPWESDQACWHAVQRKHERIQKIKTELQRRKDSHWASLHSYKKGILIAAAGGIVATIFLRSCQQNDQAKLKTHQLQPPKIQQPIQVPDPSASPAEQKKQQPDQKRK